MKLLALDTSSIACSVALQLGDSISERHAELPREHTRLLVPMIRELLDESGVAIADLDAIVLGNGPGSFIGMRIAAAVAQGLAHAAGLGIVPVSSLAAVAAQVFTEHDAGEVIVTQDAHMNEVYLGVFAAPLAGPPVALYPERLHDQSEIAEIAAGPTRRIAAGAGWTRYPALREANRSRLDGFAEILYPRARHLLAMAARDLQAGAGLHASAVTPAYLRHKVAEPPPRSP